MMEIREYTEYNAEEILSLYASVGWTAYTDQPDTLKKGFENSLLVLAAYEGDTFQGFIRVVGDGYTIVFIQDILVYPKYHRQGIGSRLLQAVLERYRDVRQIHLATDNTAKNAAFYKSQGFHEMSEIGCRVFTRV